MKVKKAYMVVLAAALLILLAFVWNVDVSEFLTLQRIQESRFELMEMVRGNYLLAVILYIGVYILVTAFFIPGAIILALTGGFLFGGFESLIYINLGTTTGALIAFLLARYLLKKWIKHKFARMLDKVEEVLNSNSQFYLLCVRLVPIIPFSLINVFAGVTGVRARVFIWTTALGILPISAVYSFAGQRLGSIQSLEDIFITGLLLCFAVLGTLMLSVQLKKRLVH